MINKELFITYTEFFSHLHVKTTNGQIAPHKAILLLSVIDLIETNVIDSNNIYYTKQLVKQFNRNWNRYVAYREGFTARAATPFFHLSSEPFWSIKVKDSSDYSLKDLAEQRIYMNPKRMLDYIDYAVIDIDLYNLLNDSFVRANYRVLLISHYLKG